jgi:N-acetylglutamate synthase-like GNAT family acetyltransferase
MISVRTYSPGDYEGVKSLYQDSNTFGGQFDEERDSPERMKEQSSSILVAEENGIIIGTVSMLSDKRFAWLVRFAIRGECEEEVSKVLFDKASEMLKAEGHTQVLVYAPSENQKFSERYKTLGFNQGEQEYVSYWKTLE